MVLEPLPALPATVAAFVSSEADRGLAASTIHRRIAAIRLIHHAQGLPNPADAPGVREVLSGIRRSQKRRKPAQAYPLVEADIERLIAAIDSDSDMGLRDRALILVGYSGALRASELVRVCREDLHERSGGYVLDIPFSKTDQEGTGRQALLQKRSDELCPVRAIRKWFERLPTSETDSSPVFRSFHRRGAIQNNGIKELQVSRVLQRHATRAGFDLSSRITSHSLRRGYVTQQALNGASVWDIIRQTGHRDPRTVMEYIEFVRLLE